MKKILLLPVFILIIFSCKKEDPPQPEPTPVTPTPTGTFYGIFNAEKFMFWTGGIHIGQAYITKVVLHSEPQTEVALYSQGKNLGIVKANGTQLQYNNSLRIYLDSTGTVSYSAQASFQHTSTTLGAINYLSPDTFPNIPQIFADQLEDTLDKTKNFIVSLNGISYYSVATCILYNGSIMTSAPTKTVAPGATGFTFTPTDVASLKTGQQNFIRISLKKRNDQTINGKLHRFENHTYSDFNVFVK